MAGMKISLDAAMRARDVSPGWREDSTAEQMPAQPTRAQPELAQAVDAEPVEADPT